MKIRVKTEGSRFWDDTRPCPQCLVEGRGQHPLKRTEITGGGLLPDGTEREPFHEVHYFCNQCGRLYYDIE